MARTSRSLIVYYTPESRTTLDKIWEWNAQTYHKDHADDYISFLQAETDKLATKYLQGKIVPTRPEFRYSTISRSRRGHKHVVIFEI